MRGYLAQSVKAEGKVPGVVVIHENREQQKRLLAPAYVERDRPDTF